LFAPVERHAPVLDRDRRDDQQVAQVARKTARRPGGHIEQKACCQQQPERGELAFGVAPSPGDVGRHGPAQRMHHELHRHQRDQQGLVTHGAGGAFIWAASLSAAA
jgi:hypothetical protein